MAESILPGVIHRETEYVRGLTGACGPNALAMGSCWSRQSGAPDTAGMYTFMRSRGLCEVSGACTIEQLRQAAQLLGFTLPEVRTYGEPWGDWRSFFLRHAGQQYILMETADGQALRDAISNKGENATNLHYHFIGVVGHHEGGFSPRAGRVLPPGWWCCDGDNFVEGDVLQFYPDDVMTAAHPCAALALAGKVQAPHMPWTRNADGTAHDDHGHKVGQGFATLVLAKYAQTSGRTGEVYYDQGKSFCLLDNGAVLNWNQQTGVHDDHAADVVGEPWDKVQAVQQALAQCQSQPHANPAADQALALAQSLKELLGKV
jgi:hypothetical protein